MTKQIKKKIDYCSICGSSDVVIKDVENVVEVPFSKPISYHTKVCYCNECGADIRISGESQAKVESKIFASARESIPALLEDLSRRKYSDERIEKALYLPKGTVKRWKERNVTAEEIALIRFLYLIPELIIIAEEGYDIPKTFKI